jgi:hypothetical protein
MGDTLAAWVGAGTTFLAVLVALFGPRWERRRLRPILVLLADPPAGMDPGSGVVSWPTVEGWPCCWMRVAVGNVGRTTADDVRLIWLRIETPQPLEKQPPARELKWADIPVDKATLPPNVTRLVDLLHVIIVPPSAGAPRRGFIPGVMAFKETDEETRPDSFLWRDLGPGRHTVHLRRARQHGRGRDPGAPEACDRDEDSIANHGHSK